MKNEITIARKAIKKAIKLGEIEYDTSAMQRVAIDAIGKKYNEQVTAGLAWHAVKDVYFAR